VKLNQGDTFVLVNEDAGADVTAEALVNIAAALEHVLQHAFKAAHGLDYHCRGGSPTIGANEHKVNLKAQSDVAGAGGYHDDGTVNCFRDGLPSLSTGDFAFSVVISHEVFETALDPGANRWAADTTGKLYALEACDAVEGFSFVPPIPDGQPGAGVSISDFLLGAFFDPAAEGPYSHLGKPSGPFKTATDGGADYQIVMSYDPSGEQQVTAIGTVHPDRSAAKAHPSSRSSRRGLVVPVSPKAITHPAPASAP
jgi:hypothetical protein